MPNTPRHLKYLFLSLVVGIGINFAFAWSGPPGSPPACPTGSPGCDAPINTGTASQTKNGYLYINSLFKSNSAVFGNMTPTSATLDVLGDINATSKVISPQFCMGSDCKTAWSQVVGATNPALSKIGTLTAPYGSINVSGSTDGYAGIYFSDENRVLMVDSVYQGIWNSTSGWQWYWNNGTLEVGSVPISRIPDISNASVNFAGSAGTLATAGRSSFTTDDSGFHVVNSEGTGSNVRLGSAWGRPGIYNNPHITIGSENTIYFVTQNVERARIDSSANLTVGGTIYQRDGKTVCDSGNNCGYLTSAGTITGVTASTGLTGGGTSGNVTLTNSGVTGVTAGSGISVSGATGNVTISSTISGYLTGTKVDSFNGRTGAVSLSSGDVTGALTYTPVSGSGSTNTVPFWSGASSLGNSPITISASNATFANDVYVNDLHFSSTSGGPATWVSQLQRRVTGTCSSSQKMLGIDQNGTVSCGTDADTNSGGTITGVTASTGLTGGGTSGSVSLSADTTYLQRRASGTCSSSQKMLGIDQNGTVSCGTDADTNSGGTITGVTASTGLTGGGTSGNVTLTNSGVTGVTAGSGISVSGATGNVTISSTISGYLTGTKVDSFNGRTGAVSLSSGDVTGALGYTPYNSSNPNTYISSESDPTVPVYAKSPNLNQYVNTTSDTTFNTVNTYSWIQSATNMYAQNFIGSAGVYDSGSRVYSASNPPPSVYPAGILGGVCDLSSGTPTWPATSCENGLNGYSIAACASGWTMRSLPTSPNVGGQYVKLCIKN